MEVDHDPSGMTRSDDVQALSKVIRDCQFIQYAKSLGLIIPSDIDFSNSLNDWREKHRIVTRTEAIIENLHLTGKGP